MNEVPQSRESESQVLGSFINFPESIEEFGLKLTIDHFFTYSNRIIFTTIMMMSMKNTPVDVISVTNCLRDQWKLENVGGAYEISKIASSVFTQSNLAYNIGVLEEKYRLRKIIEMSNKCMTDAYLSEDSQKLAENIENGLNGLYCSLNDDNRLSDSIQGIHSLISEIRAGRGISARKTGIAAIDNALMGISPGMMDVYAAEAGSGKTALIEMIALSFLEREEAVIVFQKDMTPKGFVMRLAARMAKVSLSKIRRHGEKCPRDVDKFEEAVNTLSKVPLLLYSPDGCSGKDIKSIVKREKRKNSVKLVIIDHVRTLAHSQKSSWEGLAENSGYIRQSTNQTEIPHVVLAHINREGAKAARPHISDIKGGDQLKDDADNCCLMWAPKGKGNGEEKWDVNFAFDKTRWDFGAVETMEFHGPTMTFQEKI